MSQSSKKTRHSSRRRALVALPGPVSLSSHRRPTTSSCLCARDHRPSWPMASEEQPAWLRSVSCRETACRRPGMARSGPHDALACLLPGPREALGPGKARIADYRDHAPWTEGKVAEAMTGGAA